MSKPYYLNELCPKCRKFHLVKNGTGIYCAAWWCRLKTYQKQKQKNELSTKS